MKHSNYNVRQIVLGLAAMAFLLAFLMIPKYSTWLDSKVLKLYSEMGAQSEDLSADARMKEAYIGFYHLYGEIKEYFSKPELSTMSILTPSKEYLKNKKISPGYLEESIIYYMTGVRSEQVKKGRTSYTAAYALVYNDQGAFDIKVISSRKEFERYLNLLSK